MNIQKIIVIVIIVERRGEILTEYIRTNKCKRYLKS